MFRKTGLFDYLDLKFSVKKRTKPVKVFGQTIKKWL
jgi:hypothetical protein